MYETLRCALLVLTRNMTGVACRTENAYHSVLSDFACLLFISFSVFSFFCVVDIFYMYVSWKIVNIVLKIILCRC